MLSILYDIVVQPLVYLIELVFSLGYKLTGIEGISIVGVSIVVNLLCLPLYRMADAAQEVEREKQASMKRWVDHINEHFSGDERVMMLSTYYREQHYHPAQALVGSLSLLLQIPFFMAAYNYLSSLSLLRGASFLFLTNLGEPDALLTLGGFSINMMPIAMTVLNCVSTSLYTRGLPLRDKVQAYGLAAVFLVLLWGSPSGLVFYWTCNQLFSLGKNVFMKVLPEPRKWALLLAQACVALAAGWLVVTGRVSTARRIIALMVALGSFETLWMRAYAHGGVTSEAITASPSERKRTVLQFLAGGVLLTTLLGALIPSALIADSPTEFMVGTMSPLRYVLHTTCVWGGAFILWWGTYFVLSDEESKERHALAILVLCGVCLLDYFCFGQGLGTITTTLVYDDGVRFATREQLFNLAAIAAVTIALCSAWRWQRRYALLVTCAVACSLVAMTVLNAYAITTAVSQERAVREGITSDLLYPDGAPREILHLSKSERNVVVVFIDKAISAYLPFIMAERPELYEQFDGFTYYPNTLSHGWFTNYGAPGLYGGYEYVPAAMNERSSEKLRDKHNEAMLLLPTLMSEAGLRTTVTDPPYAGSYQYANDLSLYDGLENVEAYDLDGGVYTQYVQARLGIDPASDIDRRFIYYSALKTVPEVLQRRLYDKGRYLAVVEESYPKQSLMDRLSALEVLPEITDADSDVGGFVLFENTTTHEEDFLQLPDYEMSASVDNDGLEDWSRFELDGVTLNEMTRPYKRTHYHVNAAALIRLGRWFEWLQEEGVWDNTRIIVVSDHGRNLKLHDEWVLDEYLDLTKVNPLLMVKDFGATGFTVDNDFMTNADVPTIALGGIVDNPVNPFTGNAINSDEKYLHDQLVTLSGNWDVLDNDGYVHNTADAPWYSVHDDIFNLSNWRRYDTFEQAIAAVPQ